MKTTKRIFTFAVAMIASALFIQPANAQCYSNLDQIALATTASYEMTSGGQLCAGQNPVIHFPGTQRAISICVSVGKPVTIELTIRSGVTGPIWTLFAANVANQCYNIPSAAMRALRVVPSADTTGEIAVGVGF